MKDKNNPEIFHRRSRAGRANPLSHGLNRTGSLCLSVKSILSALAMLLVSLPLYPQGFLHREGKYLFDGSGREVILRGLGTGNWMLQEGYMMLTSDVAGTQHEFRTRLEATVGKEKTALFYDSWLGSHFREIDVDSMKSWGYNCVRAALHYKWFTLPIEEEPVPGENSWLEKGFALTDSLLRWCSAREMYLILDLHGAPGGQGKEASISDYDPSKPALWESQANKDKTIALWRKLAGRYSREPWIGGYDLINETNWSFPEGNNSKLRELMVNITKAIREEDKNHLIIVEGNGFANDFSGLTPPWDSNMAYSFHKYWNYNTAESIRFATNLRNNQQVPVWLGESGENSNAWFTELIALCEKNRIGWAFWPVKKAGLNNPLRVTVNSDYLQLIRYWKGEVPHPGAEAAFDAVMRFAAAHRLENCSYQKDVTDAMIRQPHTAETMPFRLYRAGEPVFAVDYNLGRSGYAYFDTDSSDFHGSTGTSTSWNQGYSYRNDGVDMERCTDSGASRGYNVGWTADGEWMEYTLVSDSAAGYTVQIRHASGSGGSRVRLEVDGLPATPPVSLPGTGGWQNWQTARVAGVLLPAGNHKIRFRYEQGGSNLHYFLFGDPVAAASVPFRFLYAETSTDGRSVTATFNKPVSGISSDTLRSRFSVTCDNQPVSLTGIAFGDTSGLALRISLGETLYYGGMVRLSVTGALLSESGQLLDPFTDAPVTNRLPLRVTLPARIQAEDFAANQGLVSESCSDTGGGLDMGYAAPGDYLDYRVYVPKEGTYSFQFRVASQRASSQLIIQTGEGNSFTPADTLTIESTGGWQNWKTITTKAFLPGGRYTLRLLVRTGEFNTNWFQVSSIPSAGRTTSLTHELQLYPNPAGSRVTIGLAGFSGRPADISIRDMTGRTVGHYPSVTAPLLHISTAALPEGIYAVIVSQEGLPVAASMLVIRQIR